MAGAVVPVTLCAELCEPLCLSKLLEGRDHLAAEPLTTLTFHNVITNAECVRADLLVDVTGRCINRERTDETILFAYPIEGRVARGLEY